MSFSLRLQKYNMNKEMRLIYMSVFFFLLLPQDGYTREVYLKNKDRISGEIIREDKDTISLKTEAMGIVIVQRNAIDRIVSEKEEFLKGAQEKLWRREFSLGYNKASGNSSSSQLAVQFMGSKKTKNDEWTVRADVYYSSVNKKMDTQKWSGSLRYAFSFGKNKKWYNYYKFGGDHDRFADIDWRLIPSVGMGYWFSDTDIWKAMGECGIGFEHTAFRSDIEDSDEAVLTPRVFFERELSPLFKIAHDMTMYPSLTEGGDFRLHSEISLVNAIKDNLSLKLSFIVDYDSHPPPDTKKKDTYIISALNYSF